MTTTEEEFQQRLLATFREEAAEHLQAITAGVLSLEKGGSTSDHVGMIETIYREAHSLKGAARAVNLREIEAVCQPLESLLGFWKNQGSAARAVNLREIEAVCQPLESLLGFWKNQGSAMPSEHFDLILRTVSVLEGLVSQAGNGASADQKALAQETAALLNQVLAGAPAAAPTPPPAASPPPAEAEAASAPPPEPSLPGSLPIAELPPAAPQPASSGSQATSGPAQGPSMPTPRPTVEKHLLTDTIRVDAAKLDALLLQAEEFIAAKLIAGQRVVELRETVAEFPLWQKQWSKVQPLLRELRRLADAAGNGHPPEQFGRAAGQLTEFLEFSAELIKRLEQRLTPMMRAAEQDTRVIGGLVDNLLTDVKKVLMLPFSMVLETFPKFVRDLAREQGKEVEFTSQGGEVEIDRRILQEMKDPLMHLVRNSIDHGLETPAERRRRQKPPRGCLSITVAQRDSGKVEICVADDGAGIDPEKVKAAAVRQGVISAAEAESLTPAEARQLIFRSGVSTSPIITTISGRGLGMAIVQEKVEKMGGSLQVEDVPTGGTIFRLILPLTLATFRGTLIEAAQRLFVIPTAQLERVTRVPVADVKRVEQRDTILVNGRPLALVSLAAILGLPAQAGAADRNGFLTVLILQVGGQRVGFSVDSVLNEQEVLVKNLGPQLVRVRNIAGATVLGSGAVVPILNVSDLIASAVRKVPPPAVAAAAGEAQAPQQTKSILVAEDSITARTLLKNILELAGYRVQTAVDGVEGFSALQRDHFDLVVSDVEMPRMNGFELTARIRQDKRLAELPVILVTALESPEDRKRGIDVGANAYLVKSSFDQGNLLSLIQQLI